MKYKFFVITIILLVVLGCSEPQPCPSELKFNPEGNITMLEDELYTGRCMVFNEDGNKASIQQYLNGVDYGNWIFYFNNGNTKTKGKFKNGKKVGVWKYYYENGNLKLNSKYSESGKKIGVWKVYDSLGSLTGENRY